MTPSEVIARLRELHAKATAGEWVIWGLKSRHGHLTIGIEKETGPAKHICEMAWLRDLREQGASGGDDAAAIVAAMNSLPALLDAAEACGELLNAIDAGRMRQTVGVTGQTMDAQLRASVYDRVPAYPVEQAREKHMYAIAALQALAEGGE